MLDAIRIYFNGEQQESLLFIAVGLLAIALSARLWLTRHRLRAMAYPLVVIALIQLVVGASVYLRTDAQVARLSAQAQAAPAVFKAEETRRMQLVLRNFHLYEGIEIALLTLGVLGLLLRGSNPTARGVALGLILQPALMFGLDLAAQARADLYLRALGSL